MEKPHGSEHIEELVVAQGKHAEEEKNEPFIDYLAFLEEPED